MTSTNFERMIELAVETFAAHNDPEQLDVNEQVIEQLKRLHPATLADYIDGDGPVVWILLIPTTASLMNQFITNKISESELLSNTPVNETYNALYLCSALVLPEYRRKGLAKQVGLKAIKQIRDDHPIQTLFTWNFSKEGELLAGSIAQHESLPLLKRERIIHQK